MKSKREISDIFNVKVFVAVSLTISFGLMGFILLVGYQEIRSNNNQIQATGKNQSIKINETHENTGEGAPVIVLSASPSSITQGDQVALQWSTENASRCYASGSWRGDKNLSGVQMTSNIIDNATFTLICENSNGESRASIMMNTAPID